MLKDKRFAVKLDSFSLLENDKALAALQEEFQPKEGLNYIAFTYHATAPEVNMKAMGITVPTMRNSVESALQQMIDFEHRIEDIDIPANEDFGNEIMGHIVAMSMGEIPDAGNADAWILSPFIPAESILTTGVMALYTRVFKIQMIAEEVRRGASWFFSLEIGQGTTEPAIWLKANDDKPNEIIPWGEATEELRGVASQPRLMEFEGRQVAYLMGGADGFVPFIGGAITSNPAGFEQRQPGHQLRLIASMDGAIQDTVGDKVWKSDKWKKQIKASLKTRKEASNSEGEGSGIISPVMVTDIGELVELTDTFAELVEEDDDTGGENQVATIEIEEEELARRIAEGKTEGISEGDTAGYERGKSEGEISGVEAAVESGTHIAADQVDGIVEKRVMSQARTTRISSLPCSDKMKADFQAIASDEARYPLDAEGATKFDEAFTEWGESMKTASGDGGGEGGGDGNNDGNRNTASTGGGNSELNMGSGGGNSGGSDSAMDEIPPMAM